MNVFEQPVFVMHGARGAIAAGLRHVEEQVKGIEQAVIDNPGLAFDLSKSLVESCCRTILLERSITFSDEEDVPRLFKEVANQLSFLPVDASDQTEARASLRRTLGGLSAAVQGICELRNRCGFASHGDGAPRPRMESAQALLAAEAADTVVGFLYRMHEQDRVTPPRPPQYGDSAEFNEWVDNSNDAIRVFEIDFLPSQVLFEMEPESYRIYMSEFAGNEADASGETT